MGDLIDKIAGIVTVFDEIAKVCTDPVFKLKAIRISPEMNKKLIKEFNSVLGVTTLQLQTLKGAIDTYRGLKIIVTEDVFEDNIELVTTPVFIGEEKKINPKENKKKHVPDIAVS